MKQKEKSIDQLVEFHRSHKIFGLRARQELKRAERYCEFLSLVTIDITSLSQFAPMDRKNRQSSTSLQQDLEKVIRGNVRETDIVSKFENNRLALLLSETPPEGANCLCKRLKEGIRAFTSSWLKLPQQWEAFAEIVSFPDKEEGRERFLTFTEKFT